MNRIAAACLVAGALLAVSAGLPAKAQPMMKGPYGGGPPSGGYQLPPGDAAAGQHLAATRCAACHGTDGNSAAAQYPKLAGQNPRYLYGQLLAFQRGFRRSSVMAPLVANLSDQQMAALARFYAKQTTRPDPVADPRLARIGRQIFFEPGGPGVPSCATCHGGGGDYMPMGRMMGGAAPNLYGQHAIYTLNQLNRYASGIRPGGPMNRIAAMMTTSQRKAVAAYLAGTR